MPELVYKGNEKGIMKLFRACKKITAKNTSFKEEYLLLKKRPRSQGRPTASAPYDMARLNNVTHIENVIKQSYIESRREPEEKNETVRAKSIETRKKRLLEESIRFINRLNVMRHRRAQFFAPAIKKIGIHRPVIDKEYEEYVFAKRKIRTDGVILDENFMTKNQIYRRASADAILRQSEYLNREPMIPGHIKKGFHPYDLEALHKAKEQGELELELESARSVILDKDYQKAVENYHRKEIEIKRYRHHEEVPEMEKILHEKHLKIVCKMTNMKFSSINDIFENSGPGRFMTDREKRK